MSVKPHAELIRDLASRRAAIAAARGLITEAAHVTADDSNFRPAIAAHVEAMQQLFNDTSGRRTSFTLGEASAAVVDRVARIRAGQADPNAIKTGIASVDKFTGGLHRGEVCDFRRPAEHGQDGTCHPDFLQCREEQRRCVLLLDGNADDAIDAPVHFLPPVDTRHRIHPLPANFAWRCHRSADALDQKRSRRPQGMAADHRRCAGTFGA